MKIFFYKVTNVINLSRLLLLIMANFQNAHPLPQALIEAALQVRQSKGDLPRQWKLYWCVLTKSTIQYFENKGVRGLSFHDAARLTPLFVCLLLGHQCSCYYTIISNRRCREYCREERKWWNCIWSSDEGQNSDPTLLRHCGSVRQLDISNR